MTCPSYNTAHPSYSPPSFLVPSPYFSCVTCALLAGHDHGNDWCCRKQGISLCWGRHSGYGGYGTWYGIRVHRKTNQLFLFCVAGRSFACLALCVVIHHPIHVCLTHLFLFFCHYVTPRSGIVACVSLNCKS